MSALPRDISRFESHLKQPVRMHNIREKMQRSGKFNPIITENNSEVIISNGISVDPIDVYAKTQHVYAEVIVLKTRGRCDNSIALGSRDAPV